MPVKKPLDRRTFLQGAGASLALPFLEAMLPVNKTWAAEPARFGVFFRGHGMTSAEGKYDSKGNFIPAPNGKHWHPEILNFYANYPTTYLWGMRTQQIKDNHREIPAFMANTTIASYKKHITVDQIAASFLNTGTSLSDGLYLGTRQASNRTNLDAWLSHSYGTKNPMYWNPRTLFDLLTRSGSTSGTTTPTQLALKKDVLSLTMDSMKSLQRQISSQDKIVLDKALTAYRQAEVAIQNLENGTSNGNTCGFPSGILASYDNALPGVTLPLLADLAAIALNCGITRTFAFMLLPDGSGDTNTHDHLFNDIGYPIAPSEGDWLKFHNWAHNRWTSNRSGNNVVPHCRKAMETGCRWENKDVVARFLSKIDSQVLNASAIVLGSGGTFDSGHPGEDEIHDNCPFVIFGNMGGKLTPQGQKMIDRSGYEVGNAFFSILKTLGYTGNSFGDFNNTKTMSFT